MYKVTNRLLNLAVAAVFVVGYHKYSRVTLCNIVVVFCCKVNILEKMNKKEVCAWLKECLLNFTDAVYQMM